MDDRTPRQIEAMLRSHVEAALHAIWHTNDLTLDDDGDWPFRADTSACWVRVRPGDQPFVQVLAHAAYGVPRSAKLLTELNDINRRAQWTKVFWSDGYVVSEANLHWTDVDPAGLERLMGATCAMCDDVGPMIATVYGGSTPLQPIPEPADDGQDAA